MDFIVGLPKSSGYDSILVITDRFSKMATLIPTYATVNAREVVKLVFKNVLNKWGMPLEMLSDRDPKCVANF